MSITIRDGNKKVVKVKVQYRFLQWHCSELPTLLYATIFSGELMNTVEHKSNFQSIPEDVRVGSDVWTQFC